jgi:hypothetical protein
MSKGIGRSGSSLVKNTGTNIQSKEYLREASKARKRSEIRKQKDIERHKEIGIPILQK